MMMKKYARLMGSLLGVVLLVTSLAYAQCPDDITSLWALDEDNGDFLSDSVGLNDGVGGLGVAGALSPAPVDGIVNGAQQFDGADTVVNVAADDSFNWAFGADFSIEYWIKRTNVAFSDNEVVVGRDDGATSAMQWWTGLWTDGTAAFVLIATNGTGGVGSRLTGEFLEGNDVLTDGEWHHVAVVRDSATNENRLYVDGVLNDSVIIAYDDGEGFESATANLNMGWLNLDAGYHYNGTLDEVAIYGRVLTAAEILQHFNDKSSYCPPDPDDDDKDKNGGGGGSSCFIESLR